MAEGSPVKEHQCEERREPIYKDLKELRTEVDKMKGGIAVLKWVLPIMISTVSLVGYQKLEALQTAIKNLRMHYEKSNIKLQRDVVWDDKTGKMEYTEEPAPVTHIEE